MGRGQNGRRGVVPGASARLINAEPRRLTKSPVPDPDLVQAGTDTSQDHVRLLICDDHRILTEALSVIVERDAAIEQVTQPVDNPTDAIEACRELHPDVVLMDIDLKAAMTGIEATREIKTVSPDTSVVILTSYDDDRLLVSAVEAGASGFLRKTEAVQDVVETVKAAARNEVVLDSRLLARMVAQVARERQFDREETQAVERLTAREVEVLRLLAEGLRSEAIAERMFISVRTVQTHIHNTLAKLGVRSRLEAVALATRADLLAAPLHP